MVIITHSYGLTGLGNQEPFLVLTEQSISYAAVNIFFVVSGFLIAASWINRPIISIYLSSRFLRIFPALWVSVFLSIFIVGPIYTKFNLIDYFLHRDFFVFAAENSTLILKGVYTHLPGVFTDSPSSSVNESLWTLPFELKMYIAILFLGLVGLLKFPKLAILLYLTFTVLHLCTAWYGVLETHHRELLRLAGYFSAGTMYYLYKDKIKLSYYFTTFLLALTVLGYMYSVNVGTTLLTLSLPYFVLVFAYLPKGTIRKFNQLGDYSYGLYIYAFPVQQILLSANVKSVYTHIAASYVLTLLLAIISWRYIENPALSKRHQLATLLSDKGQKIRSLVSKSSSY